MKTYVALFRGINVGGQNALPMASLRTVLAELGGQHVRTYIQSGNAVFLVDEEDPAALEGRIGMSVEKRHGFRPLVLVLPAAWVIKAIAGNPFQEAEAHPKTLHVYFLAFEPGAPDFDKLEALKAPGERYVLDGDLFYLHAPDGIARSKLAAGAEKALGVPATARNWRTVGKIANLVHAAGS